MADHIQLVSNCPEPREDANAAYLRIASKIVETVAFEVAHRVPAETVQQILALASEIEKAGEAITDVA